MYFWVKQDIQQVKMYDGTRYYTLKMIGLEVVSSEKLSYYILIKYYEGNHFFYRIT